MATNFVLVLFFYGICGAQAAKESYVAAVFEHAPYLLDPKTVVSKEEARAIMQRNLDVYEEQVTKAKSQGADIIIFPEDGLYGYNFTRATQEPYLEDIPSPDDNSCPCSDPLNNQTMPIQYRLSCLAKDNGIFVVANAGDIKPCAGDPNCPTDGRFQYNTNVAYDRSGCLVARYHKQHLYYEFQFDQPTQVEFSYFDTPFGRFGLAICFDILFKNPIIDLVQTYNVTDIAFSTAWMDALPLLSAIGFHSGWARGMGVNLLSANLHRPNASMTGSGIFSSEGVLAYTRTDKINGALLVSNVSVVAPQNKPEMKSKVIKNPNKPSDVFQSILFKDTFNFVYLDPDDRSDVVCQKSVCCRAKYRATGKKEEYVLGALDSPHSVKGVYYLQICVVIKCANASRVSCGSPVTSSASWRFFELQLEGTFKTPYIFPQVITNGVNMPGKDSWTYEDKTITFQNVSDDMISTALVSRWYAKDNKGDDKSSADNAYGGFITMWIVLMISQFFM